MGPKTSGTTGADFDEQVKKLFELPDEEEEKKEEETEGDKKAEE